MHKIYIQRKEKVTKNVYFWKIKKEWRNNAYSTSCHNNSPNNIGRSKHFNVNRTKWYTEQAQLADLESLIENGGESVYDTTSGANKPALSKGMIPVKWDTSKAKWVICTKNDPEWYNYNESKNQWANVMLCDGTYNESTAVGTEVAEEDLGSMFVWIPRFAYKITSGYHGSPEGGMDVKFLIGRTDKTEDGAKVVEYNATTTSNYSKFPDGYVVHPAFKDGSSTGYSSGEWKSEVLGIWVAKFQAGVKTTDKDTDKTVSSVSNYYYPLFKVIKFGYNYIN